MFMIRNRHRWPKVADGKLPTLTAVDLEAHIEALARETDQTVQTLSVWARQIGRETVPGSQIRRAS